MGRKIKIVQEEDYSDSRFKVGEIVYVAEEDVNSGSYYPKMYEIVAIEVESLKHLNEEILRRYIYGLVAPKSNILRITGENEIFGSFAGAHVHCNILNYGIETKVN